ncbi:MAG: FAD-binding protein [Pseudomonadota bacterium]
MTSAPSRTNDYLAERLRQAVRGDVLASAFDRGRYATDASIYQMMPAAVVVPRDLEDVAAVCEVAREEHATILPRGGGTSQCGQTVNAGIVLDLSKHLNKIVEINPQDRTAVVEPGIVLDHLNAALKPHGLWYPVDVSTSSRATIGGMTANNSCGSRSIRYGTSRDNVLAIDALLADGSRMPFGPLTEDARRNLNGHTPLVNDLLALGGREAEEIAHRFPNVIRRVGGYNIDALVPDAAPHNLAHLLVGSEGTLAFSELITLKLSPLLGQKVLGICHFPTFYQAMDAAQHLVKLQPTAVELIDHNMIALGRDIPIFKPVVDSFVRGEPEALLVVEFAELEMEENLRRLRGLHDVMADLGFAWDDPGKQSGGVVEAIDPQFQAKVLEVRKQGLNIMMSMKSDGKPISFVEDCAVELPDLADYTDNLTAIFRKYGTDGTWYAHASVGTLHVRPVLNLKGDADLKSMRAIAEECFELVRSYKGSHSGEHGDGIVRSEFHRPMFGDRMVENFEWVKDRMDPAGLFNPGKIVRPPKFDDRTLLRYHQDYHVPDRETVFNWPGYSGAARGMQGAVEMCNNNGACRKTSGGVMCPSYRVTRNEKDLVRGRANTLRLAMSGQLGEDAFASDEMAETMKLCVSCKACRRECPMNVDMAKLKVEMTAARNRAKGLSIRDRLVGYLPRYAPYAARAPWLLNMRNWVPGARALGEAMTGMSAARPLPHWAATPFREPDWMRTAQAPDVIFFADTFNRYFEPEILDAGVAVLQRFTPRLGAALPAPSDPQQRPLDSGRTFLSVGLADEARAELQRVVRALRPALERGAVIVGLEPSCTTTFRDEAPALLGDQWHPEWSNQFVLLEEFIADRLGNDAHAAPAMRPLSETALGASKILLHGHCHQKAFNIMTPVLQTLQAIPDTEVELIETSCCGMAGAFGYQAETRDVSMAMAELNLLPAVRAADDATLIVADGTSCRHQIADGAQRSAIHVAQVLQAVLH